MASINVISAAWPALIARARHLADIVFDSGFDETARDSKKTFVARLVATVSLGVIAEATVGLIHALIWVSLVLAGELVVDLLRRRHFPAAEPATMAARLVYLTTILVMVLIWTSMPVMFWFSSAAGVNASAIIILATMIIHAEAFTFRSIPVLIVTGGPPALVLILLPWLDAAFTGLQGVTFATVAALGVGYACVSVHAHRISAKSLQAAQDELEHFAYYDALTSLANRRQFTGQLRRLIASSERRGTRFALLLLDLDQFKQVNDTLGHDAGDALLVAIGARLRQAVRVQDDVARLGGDEFAILLPEADDASAISAVCERIGDMCGEGIVFNGTPVQFSLSVGYAIFPDNGDHHETLYKSADLALYKAKRLGRNTWCYSDATLAQIALRSSGLALS